MLKSLSIRHVRNIQALDCTLSPEINFFYGENGSGKSSTLEAAYLLSMGRSFRTHLLSRVINHDAEKLMVFAETYRGKIGIEKTRSGQTSVRMNHQNLSSIAELAAILPVQLIEPHSYRLLEGPPKQRRQLLDWGVFHVEHRFLEIWREASRALKHRNAAIRQGLSKQQINLWNPEIVRLGDELTMMRESYLTAFLPQVEQVMGALCDFKPEFSFYPGWKREKGLAEVLEQSYERDAHLGYTQFGPHRADLKIRFHGQPAVDALSRGQQKILLMALCLSQGLCLKEQMSKHSLYLIDDIAAELDPRLSEIVLDFLMRMQAQVMITSVNPSLADKLGSSKAALFKISSGSVCEFA